MIYLRALLTNDKTRIRGLSIWKEGIKYGGFCLEDNQTEMTFKNYQNQFAKRHLILISEEDFQFLIKGSYNSEKNFQYLSKNYPELFL